MSKNNKPLPPVPSTSDNKLVKQKPTAPGVAADNHRPPKALKVALIIIAVITVTIVSIIIFYIISLSGGIQAILLNHKSAPNPNSTDLIYKRSTSINDITTLQAKVKQNAGLTYYAKSTGDSCFTGQNDWKIHQGFAHRCTYGIVYYYGFNGNFKQTLQSIDKNINNLGLQSVFPISKAIASYDKFDGKDIGLGRLYLVSDLPLMSSSTPGQVGWQINAAEKTTDKTYLPLIMPASPNLGDSTTYAYYSNIIPLNVTSLFNQIIIDNRYMLAITVNEDYFAN